MVRVGAVVSVPAAEYRDGKLFWRGVYHDREEMGRIRDALSSDPVLAEIAEDARRAIQQYDAEPQSQDSTQ